LYEGLRSHPPRIGAMNHRLSLLMTRKCLTWQNRRKPGHYTLAVFICPKSQARNLKERLFGSTGKYFPCRGIHREGRLSRGHTAVDTYYLELASGRILPVSGSARITIATEGSI